MTANGKSGRFWALMISIAVVILTLVPLIFGYQFEGSSGELGRFCGATYDAKDTFGYFSWMLQVADGSFGQKDLFTTLAQEPHLGNIVFILLGLPSRFLSIPIVFMFHFGRILFGLLFLTLIWRFFEFLINDERIRKTSFLVLAFSSGFGWIQASFFPIENWTLHSSDMWQPEVSTFFSIYNSPLQPASLLLMTGFMFLMMIAERKKSLLLAFYAGLCGFILGNVHTYDIITIAAIWGTYLIVQCIIQRNWKIDSWARAALAGALSLISTGYMYYIIKFDKVYNVIKTRTATLSPSVLAYFLGFGLALILAIGGLIIVIKMLKNRRSAVEGEANGVETPAPILDSDASILIICWLIINFSIAYIPLKFQGRLINGEIIPISIFCGIFLCHIFRNLGEKSRKIAIAVVIIFLSITNCFIVYTDINKMRNNERDLFTRYYIYNGEKTALAWLRKNVSRDMPIQALPWIEMRDGHSLIIKDTTLAGITPALTGNQVHCGHWSDTPDFYNTVAKWLRFTISVTPGEERREFLEKTGVRYIIFSQKRNYSKEEAFFLSDFLGHDPPDYLRFIPEASNEDADVYEVIRSNLN